MFRIIYAFSKTSLNTFFNKHPFIKKFMISRMKKFDITFEERYYIHLTSRFHRNFWITERHLIPISNSKKDRLNVIINNCPVCTGEHPLNDTQINFLKENYPLLIQDLEYISKYATNYALQIYRDYLKSGKSEEFAREEFHNAYFKMADYLACDSERGRILIFPTKNCS